MGAGTGTTAAGAEGAGAAAGAADGAGEEGAGTGTGIGTLLDTVFGSSGMSSVRFGSLGEAEGAGTVCWVDDSPGITVGSGAAGFGLAVASGVGNPVKFNPGSLLPIDQKKIVPITPKATTMPINSSKPSREERGSGGGDVIYLSSCSK